MTEVRVYTGTFNLELLAETLYGAFTSLRDIRDSGLETPLLFECPDDSTLFLYAPDGTDWDRMDTIISAHNPNDVCTRLATAATVGSFAGSVEGAVVSDLTTEQILQVLTLLLHRVGGVDSGEVITPIESWSSV